jgi:Tol biopolymer transport system component
MARVTATPTSSAAPPPEQSLPEPGEKPAGSVRFDWTYTILISWFIGGIFLDGWTQNHTNGLASGFTLGQLVMYAGFLALAIYLGMTANRNHSRGYRWPDALPDGYFPALIGAGLVLGGGLLDILWQSSVGVEQGLETRLSPPHLIVGVGEFLLFCTPVRVAWRRVSAAMPRLTAFLPATLSLAYCAALLGFFTQFAHPLVTVWASQHATLVPSDLYVMNADGTLQTRLTTSGGQYHFTPAWSPDGKQIVYAVGDGNTSELAIMQADGTNAHVITHFGATTWGPAWSPDGKEIAFTSTKGGAADLYLIHPDGTGLVQLTKNGQPYNTNPAWSPDGKHLIFATGPGSTSDIATINADGSGLHQITHVNGDAAWPAWSPDGSEIVFASGTGTQHLMLMHPDGTNQHAIYSSTDALWSPTWSPDGKQIAFTMIHAGVANVYAVHADGSHLTNLTQNPGADNGSLQLAWSGAVNKIVYSVQGRPLYDDTTIQNLGFAGIALQTAVLLGLILLLISRFVPPLGTFTILLGVVGLLSSILATSEQPLLTALLAAIAGAAIDGLYRWLRPLPERERELRIFAFLAPVAAFAVYFLGVRAFDGLAWSVNLWGGAILGAGLVGLLLSFLIAPPGQPVATEDVALDTEVESGTP